MKASRFILFLIALSTASYLLFFLHLEPHHSTPPRQEGVLHLNFRQNPLSLDPRKGSDPISPALHFMTYQGLTRFTPQDSHAPAIANTIDISDDRCTYTFHLRKAFWSDGSRITSYDFERTWKELLSPSFLSPITHMFFVIKNAQKAFEGKVPIEEVGIFCPDENTFVVTLECPVPYFLDLTSFCAFFPMKFTQQESIGKKMPLASGPFHIQEWKLGHTIALEKNPFFWDASNVKLQGIQISVIESDLTVLKMFENGEVDFMGASFSPLPLDATNVFAKEGRIHSKPLAATTMLSFNVDRFPYTNRNIRKAIAYAICRKDLVQNITQLDELIATGCIAPIFKNNINRDFFEDGNTELANIYLEKGLQELGIAKEDFPPITISYYRQDSFIKIAQTVQQQLQEALHIPVKLSGYELKYLLHKLQKKDYEIAEFGWVAQYNDPMNIFDRFKFKANSKNYPGWENQEYIDLLNSSMNETDREKRLAILEKAEEVFVNEMPITCLYHWNHNYLLNSRVKDFYMAPIGSIHWEFARIEE